MQNDRPNVMFPDGPIQTVRGWRNSWLLNVWRMRRHTEDDVTIDYFTRGTSVYVTRVRAAA